MERREKCPPLLSSVPHHEDVEAQRQGRYQDDNEPRRGQRRPAVHVYRRGGRPGNSVEHSHKLGLRAGAHQFLESRDNVRYHLVLGEEMLLDLLRFLQHRFGVLVGFL